MNTILHTYVLGAEKGSIPPSETLAETLRERLNLTGTKTPCNKGACGGCTVLIDSEPALACSTLTAECDGRHITTIEGISDPITGGMHPIQQAFIDVDAIQCGMCTPGIVMASIGLLESNVNPTELEIRNALAGNICRCTGYRKYIDGVLLAAEILRNREEALEQTVALFSQNSRSFEMEMDDAERRGLITSENAWDYIVELVSNLVEWIFHPDYYYEKLLLNRELLSPSDAFSSVAHPVLLLYWRFEMLYLTFTENDDKLWAKHFSFMTVQTLFSYGNYPEFMKIVTERNVSVQDVAYALKADVKRDELTQIKAVLKNRQRKI